MEDVLIVGAGPTGLTLATVLARAGCRPRLIDRALQPPPDRSRAIVIQARTLELFEDIGVVDEVLSHSLVVPQANIWSPRGSRGSLLFRPEWIESAYWQLVTLPQDETERILCERALALGVTVERGVELTGIEDLGSRSGALLRHADGTTERAEAVWIVGCDGAHSAVRHAAGLAFPGLTYPDECLLGDVDLRWALPDGEVSICPTPEGVMLAFPLPGEHRFRIIMIHPAAEERADRHLGTEEFAAALTRMTPRAPGADGPTVLATRWLTRYHLHRRGVTSYRVGRCFVAGDAAHIHSPAGAQGMNTGIQDAYNLGWKLALVVNGASPESLLDSYHDERHRVGKHLLEGTDKMFAAIAGGGTVGRFIRAVVPTIAARVLNFPVFGRRLAQFVSQTGVTYRASVLSEDGPGAATLGARAPASGDRAPDAALADGTRLYARLHGGQHTVLLFGAPGMDAPLASVHADVEAAYAGWVRVVDLPTGSGAHERYGAQKGAIYLIRPDGHVSFRGAATDGTGLGDLLSRRFTEAHVGAA